MESALRLFDIPGPFRDIYHRIYIGVNPRLRRDLGQLPSVDKLYERNPRSFGSTLIVGQETEKES